MGIDLSGLGGWIDDQQAVQTVMKTMDRPFVANSPAIRGWGENKDIFLWKAEELLFKKTLPAFHQTRGTCVSQGAGRAAQDLLIINLVIKKKSEEWVTGVATEPIYIGSRVEVGGGKLGNSEGSVGAWAAKFLKGWGVLLRQVYGNLDFTNPNDDLACKMAGPGQGLPKELEDVAKEHPLQDFSQVSSFNDVRDVVCSWRPVTVASNRGFSTVRDSRGFCRPQGTWNHQMCIRGAGVAKGNIPFGVIQQSWGLSPTGNDTLILETGEEVKLPEGCFAVEAQVIDGMVKQEDSWGFSDIKGFEPRTIEWTYEDFA